MARASNVDFPPTANTACLVFALKDAAVLVAGPNQRDCEMQKDDNLVWRLIMSLAQQTALSVHVAKDLPPDVPQLSTIGEAASTPGLLRPSRHVGLASMYRGKSERVISVSSAKNNHDYHQDDNKVSSSRATAEQGLPTYENPIDPPPPPPPSMAASSADTSRK
jgi:FAD/FMN-containing dehydrogenase